MNSQSGSDKKTNMDLQPALSAHVGTGIHHLEGDVLIHTCVKCNHLNHIPHVRLEYHKIYRRTSMSFGIQPVLRPVIWSDVDNNGKLKRREPSVSSDDDAGADYSLTRKKMKAPLYPRMYYPPPLTPSEMVWSKRCESFFQKGYQLRPRYQQQRNAGRLGNGMHPITAEDHIMQIVCPIYSFIIYVGELIWDPIASSGPRCNPPKGWPCSLRQANPRPSKVGPSQNFGALLYETHDERYAESCCPLVPLVFGLV